MPRSRSLVVVLCLMITTACAQITAPTTGKPEPAATIEPEMNRSVSSDGLPLGTLIVDGPPSEVRLTVEIAETAESRATGLMGRTELSEIDGMAFLFERPTSGGFWMKNTLIGLDIAFWDEQGALVAILQMEPCEADPCPTYSPGAEYIGAVEVEKGRLERESISIGNRIRLVRDVPSL